VQISAKGNSMQPDSKPFVSIITPTYNHEKFIDDCLRSVTAQTYENWEQIVIDDGSTDRTAEIATAIPDARIHYVHQKRAGLEALAQTYNQALHQCQGSIIAVLEGDDIWPANKLSTMVAAFTDPEVVLAYGLMREIDSVGRTATRVGRTTRRFATLPRSILFNDPVKTAVAYLLTVPGHSLIPASTVLIRRSVLDSIGGFQYIPGQLYTDFPTFVKLALIGKFWFFPEVMGYRRMHALSATAQFSQEMAGRSKQHLEELLNSDEFSLPEAEVREIRKSWETVAAAGSFQCGRMLLLRRRWRDARAAFLAALQFEDILVSVAALIGWCASWIHHDLEKLYQLLGRPVIRITG
jgi:glycosyltransferase involved in cell wall biosynthesis